MIETKTAPRVTVTKERPLAKRFDTNIRVTNQPTIKAETRKNSDVKVKNPAKLVPFLFMHIACIGVLFVGISLPAVLLCVGLYALRMFALTAGYHRYFSHRS